MAAKRKDITKQQLDGAHRAKQFYRVMVRVGTLPGHNAGSQSKQKPESRQQTRCVLWSRTTARA